nr:transcription antitermination factor NusB [Nigerium massiliense]
MPHQRLRRRGADPARTLAYQVLRQVTADGAYANLATHQALAEAGLDARDAGFVTELVSGTCRLQGTYDRIIAAASGRKPGSLQPELLDVLRLGTHQLLSMRVPQHAAVDAGVELAAAHVGEKVAGLTNAVLRKVAARDLDAWIAELTRHEDALGALATRTHHPRWIAAEYVALLGDEAEAALAANNVNPAPTLVVRPGLAEVAELEGDPTRFSRFGARRPGNPADVPAVREGRAGVQDEGSQLVAAALAAVDPAPPGPWLDLCAGPGGKAALLAGLAMASGETLVASELAEHRARLVQQGLRAYTGANAPVTLCADGTRPAWADGAFAKVMADVPCTGLGALRRRPESRWRRRPADLDELVGLQRRLLTSALRAARPGGVVAYVTCSPHTRETVEIVLDVLAASATPVERLRTADLLGVPDAAREGGWSAQLWPHRHGTDGMFMALFRVGH